MGLHAGTSPRQERLLATLRDYHIRTNPDPEGIFSFSMSILTVWCTPDDHPEGLWHHCPWFYDAMSQLTKKAAVGLAQGLLLYSEDSEDIVGFTLQTHAHFLSNRGLIGRDELENRPEDIAWATQKLDWLWAQAFPTEPPPYIKLEWDRDRPKVDYSDFF
jgi:hypothetical protein